MTPEGYRKAAELFDQFRELPEHDLSAALDSGCGGDTDLRARVVSLLEADREADNGAFLGRPAIEDAARLLAPESPDLPSAGAVMGQYRLGAQIGMGGMGVVYEAEDLRLHRRVAVKLLHLSGAAEADEAIQRFQREARAISLLSHPNIVAIFDADFCQGCYYIAMEFVEGRTLRTVITSESRLLEAQTVLDIIGQTALALTAAHEAGIVHRDIKPENIMIRPDGFVKVLDFGLAKLREPTESVADLRTRPGHVAGTIQYLSPEQVTGKPVGPRSDLFSLGIVGYELATGVRPFDGRTDGAIFDAILHHAPAPPSSLRPALGRELDDVILEALEKDPELRFQTAGDMRSSCRRIMRDFIARTNQSDQAGRKYAEGSSHLDGPTPSTPPRVQSTRKVRSWLAPAALMVLLISGILVWSFRTLPAPRVTGIIQITHDGLSKEYFVNDGRRVYYAAGPGSTGVRMFQVSSGGGDPVAMPLFTGMIPFDISADGSEMLLGQLQQEPGDSLAIWTGSTVGTPPRRLGDLRAADPRWSPRGDRIVYCALPNLMVAHSDGSDSRVLVTIKADNMRYPDWSPDGRSLRLTLDIKNVPSLWEVWSDGTHLHELFAESDHIPRENGAWTPDGKYFLFSARHATEDLWAIPRERRFSIGSRSVVYRLSNGPLRADRPQASPDGRRIFFRGRLDRGELVRHDPQSNRWIPYLDGLAAMQLDYSRDGKWIAYVGYPDATVWRCAADGSRRQQLTAAPLLATNPRLSPDATQIVFYGGPAGKPSRLYLVPAAGGAVRQLTNGDAGPNGDHDGSWSPDGASIVFGPESGEKSSDGEFAPLAISELKTGRVSKLPGSGGLWSPRWSPDGRYVAALGFPQAYIWLYDLATHQRRQLTTMTASWPSWSRDSKYVYFSNTSTYRVRISDRRTEQIASLNTLKAADGSFGWVGADWNGSLISTKEAGSTEIYALDWDQP